MWRSWYGQNSHSSNANFDFQNWSNANANSGIYFISGKSEGHLNDCVAQSYVTIVYVIGWIWEKKLVCLHSLALCAYKISRRTSIFSRSSKLRFRYIYSDLARLAWYKGVNSILGDLWGLFPIRRGGRYDKAGGPGRLVGKVPRPRRRRCRGGVSRRCLFWSLWSAELTAIIWRGATNSFEN